MAISKTLVKCLFNISKTSLFRNPMASSSQLQTPLNPIGRCLLHHNKMPVKQKIFPFLVDDMLIEKLQGLNGDKIRLDVLTPTFSPKQEVDDANEKTLIYGKKVEKVSRVSQVKAVNANSRGITKGKQGLELALVLTEFEDVLILRNVIFLNPEQVAKAIKSVIPPSQDDEQEEDTRRGELRELALRKADIDKRAKALVQKEMWCGLAFMVVQTVGFMRLTFWELSWDVMEPICFYVTSIYFMLGYAFFLKTSREPSFEGFYQSRFATKQKLLMKSVGFDIDRFNELYKAISPSPRP